MSRNKAKGFGKADELLAKVTGEDPRLTNARRLGLDNMPKRVRAKVEEAVNTANFSDADWAFLAKDLGCLVTELVANDYETLEVWGFDSEFDDENGVWVGLTAWKHRPTDTTVVAVLQQETAGQPSFKAVTCFSPGATEEPPLPADLYTGVQRLANQWLQKKAAAFSFTYTTETGEKHLLADYSWGEDHALEKSRNLAQGDDNGTVTGPVYLSEHPTTCAALCFAHALNKRVGVVFGGLDYDLLVTQNYEEDKARAQS